MRGLPGALFLPSFPQLAAGIDIRYADVRSLDMTTPSGFLRGS